MTTQIANNSISVTGTATNFVSSDFQISLGPLPLPYQRISDLLRALPNVDFVEPFDQEDVIIADHQTRVFGVPATTMQKP